MKKALSLILSIVTLISLFSCLTTSVSAGDYDTIAKARQLTLGTKYSGTITSTDAADYYVFNLTASSKITVNFSSDAEYANLFVFNSDGVQICSAYPSKGSSGLAILSTTYHLVKGKYYIGTTKQYGYTGKYELKVSAVSAQETFSETESDNDNSIAKANIINQNVQYRGQIADNDIEDFYKFNISSSSKVSLNFSGDMDRIAIYMLDADGQEVRKSDPSADASGKVNYEYKYHLIKGTYYIRVTKVYKENLGNYSFKYQITSSNESFVETKASNDNTTVRANNVTLGKPYRGQLALNDSIDFYKFTLNDDTKLTVNLTVHDTQEIQLTILDLNGNTKLNTTARDYKSEETVYNTTIALTKGTYYFKVSRVYDYCTDYSFVLSEFIDTPKAKAVNTINGMNVIWNAVDGAVKYVVYKRLGTSSTWDIVATTTGTSYTDNNTPLEGSYYIYSIKAYTSTGTPSDYIKANCASVQRVVAPVTKAVNVSNGISVTWNKVSGANKYIILRRIGTESTWKTIGESTGTSFLDKNVKAGIYYIYSIRAVNNTGYSAYDINKRVTIMRILTPVVTATNATNGVQLKWNAVTGAKKYNVYRRPGGSSTFTYVGTTTGTSFVDKSVKYNGTYYIYSIRAYNGASYSAYIYGNTATIQPITAPTTKVVNKSNGVQVSWNGVTGATKYNVYRRLGGTSTWVYVGTTTGQTLLDKGAVKGKTYSYSIRAINGTGYSAYNSSKCAAIKRS